MGEILYFLSIYLNSHTTFAHFKPTLFVKYSGSITAMCQYRGLASIPFDTLGCQFIFGGRSRQDANAIVYRFFREDVVHVGQFGAYIFIYFLFTFSFKVKRILSYIFYYCIQSSRYEKIFMLRNCVQWISFGTRIVCKSTYIIQTGLERCLYLFTKSIFLNNIFSLSSFFLSHIIFSFHVLNNNKRDILGTTIQIMQDTSTIIFTLNEQSPNIYTILL